MIQLIFFFSFFLLSDTASPECNLTVSCAYYMGEIAMSIKKVHLYTVFLAYVDIMKSSMFILSVPEVTLGIEFSYFWISGIGI